MAATDAMIARYQAELEERKAFMDGLVAAAQDDGRDMKPEEMELYNRASDRMKVLEGMLQPLRDGARIAAESAHRTAELTEAFAVARNPNLLPGAVEYRNAGEYIRDYCRVMAHRDADAQHRMEMYHRVAAHQTTTDNPGLIPERLLTPILQNVDLGRPLVSAIGVQQLLGGSWSRPRVTQHTQVAKQSAEKTELASRKMIIDKVPLEADTYGGYVNVSRQNIDWSDPAVMNIIITDLSNEYSFETEEAAGTALAAAASTGPALPASPTSEDVSNAMWAAAGTVFTNMWTARTPVGRLTFAVAPDMLGLVGPLFAPVNPQNAQSSGFLAGAFGEGPQPMISGVATVVSAALAAGTALVFSSNAVEAYEDRIGALQVVEPSVLGVQVAYAGYFAIPILQAGGIVEVTSTP